MKIFNRSPSRMQATEDDDADESVIPIGQPAAKAPAGVSSSTPAADAAEEPDADQPDLSAILDANVKEMSEKIASLTTTLEGESESRAGVDKKLAAMEERMRKLSSLTEMISAQYNPFVGDAPEERTPPPAPDVGLASPAMDRESIASLPGGTAAARPLPEEALILPDPESISDPFADVPAAADVQLAPAARAPEQDDELPATPAAAEVADDDHVDNAAVAAPAPAPAYREETFAADGPIEGHTGEYQIWSVPQGFAPSMLMLGWADMLLKTARTRDNLLQLVDFYHNLGWIGEPARDQLLAYADGIIEPVDAQDVPPEWRVGVDVHERSLLFLEKLKGLMVQRG